MKSNVLRKTAQRIHLVNTRVCGPILLTQILAVMLGIIQYVY